MGCGCCQLLQVKKCSHTGVCCAFLTSDIVRPARKAQLFKLTNGDKYGLVASRYCWFV